MAIGRLPIMMALNVRNDGTPPPQNCQPITRRYLHEDGGLATTPRQAVEPGHHQHVPWAGAASAPGRARPGHRFLGIYLGAPRGPQIGDPSEKRRAAPASHAPAAVRFSQPHQFRRLIEQRSCSEAGSAAVSKMWQAMTLTRIDPQTRGHETLRVLVRIPPPERSTPQMRQQRKEP
jgi:hypothetical protein